MPKLRFLINHGNPDLGTMIRAGAVVDLNDRWADRLIKDGVAVLADRDDSVEDTGVGEPEKMAPRKKSDKKATPKTNAKRKG